MTTFLNDSLDDIFGAPSGDVRTEPAFAPASYTPRSFDEVCGKCSGTGSWRGRGQCFACKGKGKNTFKTSSESRAKARASSTARKARIEQESVDSFKVAHPAAFEWLVATAPRWDVAASLLAGLHRYGSLTDGQMGLVNKSIAREVERATSRAAEAAERAANAPVADAAGVDRLKAAFDHAARYAAEKGRGLRGSRITIGNMVISPAGAASKNPGALYVKAGGEYLGKVTDGRFFAARECGAEQSAKVLAFIADPKAAAIAYGQETGVCCVCNAPLTNKTSIEAGIGPICATKMGW